jgi:protein SCO1/2
VDSQDQSALIDGDAMPGFMDAMAMAYKLKPPTMMAQLSPGDSISADLVNIEPDYWLENVKVTGHAKPVAATTQRIPAAGDAVPDFAVTNQDGRHFSFSQYRGKVLLVTFIYTRCPFPDFCPRMSANFAEVYKQLASNPALANTQLLSLSFDPEHDSPKVLRDYGLSVAHTHNPQLFTRWQFAVPSARDLPKVADFFGLVYKPENGLITHSLSTAVIGGDGKIVKWYHGSDWQVSDLIKDATDAGHLTHAVTGTQE